MEGFELPADAYFTSGRTLENPPSIAHTWPVIQPARSDNNQAINRAKSAGSPTPGNGYCLAAPARLVSLPMIRATAGVSMIPGATALTRMRDGA